MRPSKRKRDQLREIKIETNVNKYAEGSCIIEFGNTKVLCTASVEEKVPPFLRGKKQGWLTAEYSMLPRATHERNGRDVYRNSANGRTLEIQRLIGRSLRAVVDLEKLGERQNDWEISKKELMIVFIYNNHKFLIIKILKYQLSFGLINYSTVSSK